MKQLWICCMLVLMLAAGCNLREAAVATAVAQTAEAQNNPAQDAAELALPDADPADPLPALGNGAGSNDPGNTLFRDDFQDGNTDGWKISSGWDVQQDGDAYIFSSAVKGGAWITSGGNWDDYLYRAAVRLHAGSVALFFRWTKSGRYLLQYQVEGLYLMKEAPQGEFTTLLRAAAPALDAGHSFVVGAQAGHIQVYVDKILVMDYTDADPLLQGTAGVGVPDQSSAAVDDVIVARLTKDLPAVSATPPAEAVNEPPPAFAPEPFSAAPAAPDAAAPQDNAPAEDANPAENGDDSGNGAADLQDDADEEDAAAAGQADIVVTSHTFPAAGILAGEALSFEIGVSNRGDAAAGPFTVAWYPFGSGMVGCAYDVNRLGPGQGQRFDCRYAGYPQSGEFAWRIIADIENEIRESNEANNAFNGSAVAGQDGGEEPQEDGNPPAARVPNIFLPEVIVASEANVGVAMNIRLGSYNNGNQTTGAFTMIWKPDASSNVIACSWDMDGMVPEGGFSKNCTYPGYPAPGTYTWEAVVDSENEVAESNEGDNRVTGQIIIHP